MYLVNINSHIVEEKNAKISVFDRGLLFGDSVYEVTRSYRRKIFLWPEHWRRLQFSAQQIGLKLPTDESELLGETLRLLKKLDCDNAYIRWVVTRGEGEIGLDPSLATGGNFIIFARPLEINPHWWYQQGVSLLISKIRRNHTQALDPNIKSGNYLNNLMAIKEAKERGFFDAIMLNHQGMVTEGTTFNVWTIKGRDIFTPPMQSGILRGITREKLMDIIEQTDFCLCEQFLRPEQIYQADECFITSSTKELVPVVQVDDQQIGTGRVGAAYQQLHQRFRRWQNHRLEQDGKNGMGYS